MNKRISLIIAIVISLNCFGQGNYLQFKPYKPYKWMFGIGWSVIDDDGHPYSKLFAVPNSWNYEYYPTQISVDRYIKKGLSVEATGAFNLYKGTTEINETYGKSGIFSALDVNAKYSFYPMLQPTQWFDPYVGLGIGATYRQVAAPIITPSANVMLGMNFWIKNVGLRLQTQGVFGLNSKIYFTESNYLHHSVSILYRTMGRSKKKNSFDKKRYPWTKDKPKYKGKSK